MKRIPKRLARWVPVIVILYTLVGVLSYLTNPFTRFTLVRVPFQTTVRQDGQLEVIRESSLRLRTSRFYGTFAFMKSAYHIVANVYGGGKNSKSDTLNEIIHDIHKLRFDPNEPYLISGDHFSMLYIRSLGIFYHTLLDPRTALDAEDWLNRQKIYLQTTAYALDVYKNSPVLSTTIVPVGENSVALMNIYRPPSDTLYSLFYALDVMRSSSTLENTYPMKRVASYQLQTQQAADELLKVYRLTLMRHYLRFRENVVDPSTGLVKKNILLSGTKDIAKRQSAFYDNVMVWKTDQLAQKLGLIPTDENHLNTLKQKILLTYWREDMGCFIEDQSEEAEEHLYYSSDWMIVLPTGFLDPFKEEDRPYYEKCVTYIQRNELDQPFGLQYQQEMRKDRLYPLVRFAAPEYGSTAIWSNWGVEYIKLLVLLYQTTGNDNYLKTAEEQLNAYTENIITYGCYPEVYDPDGKMYRNFLYKSVCQTGWVVTYEQAKAMVEGEL
jgi:hypothetical protein